MALKQSLSEKENFPRSDLNLQNLYRWSTCFYCCCRILQN